MWSDDLILQTGDGEKNNDKLATNKNRYTLKISVGGENDTSNKWKMCHFSHQR